MAFEEEEKLPPVVLPDGTQARSDADGTLIDQENPKNRNRRILFRVITFLLFVLFSLFYSAYSFYNEIERGTLHPANFITYVDKENRISFKYPAEWDVKEEGMDHDIYIYPWNFWADFYITMDAIPFYEGEDASIETQRKAVLEDIQEVPDLKIIKNGYSKLGTHLAGEIIFSGKIKMSDGKYKLMKRRALFFENERIGYYMNYSGSLDAFEKYKDSINVIVSSYSPR